MSKRSRFINYISAINTDERSERSERSERLSSYWHHFPESAWYSDQAVRAHLDFYAQTDIDFLKIMEEIVYDVPIKVVSDWKQYMPPKRKTKERILQCDLIKRITDKIGSECMIYTTIFDPLRTIGMATGYSILEAHISQDEQNVSKAFTSLAESITEYSYDCLDAGADGIYFSSKGAEVGRFNDETFERIVGTHDRYITDRIADINPNTILHICGFDTELKHYTDYRAAIVNWDCHTGRYNLSDGAILFPDKVILGGMENRSGVLMNGTAEEIEQEVKRVVQDFGSSNRLILSADCTLDEQVDYSRVRAAVDAYRKI